MSNDKKTYEGMFLLDAGNSEANAAIEPVRSILDRNKVEVLSLNPWDERRLAYPIRGRRRGLYVLSYFIASTASIVEIEHDCQLNEQILRVLILRKDRVSPEELELETPAMSSARRAAELATQRETAAPEDEKAQVAEEDTEDDADFDKEEPDVELDSDNTDKDDDEPAAEE